MAEPEVRRRRRPAVSCTLCRKRKIRCNREQPCSNCLRARKNVTCVYEELPPLPADDAAVSRLGKAVAAERTASAKVAGRPPLHTEGIVFRNALQPSPLQTQTATPTSSGTVDGPSQSSQSSRPTPPLTAATRPDAAVIGLTGLTIAGFCPASRQRTSRGPTATITSDTSAAVTASGNASVPTAGPASGMPSPFDREVVLGLPEFQAFSSASHNNRTQASGHASGHSSSHASPEEVQSMQQRIRRLEAQLKDERRHPDRHYSSRHERHHHHRDRRSRRHTDTDADVSAPSLPHLVVNEAHESGQMAYVTVEEPPPMTSWSHNSRWSLTVSGATITVALTLTFSLPRTISTQASPCPASAIFPSPSSLVVAPFTFIVSVSVPFMSVVLIPSNPIGDRDRHQLCLEDGEFSSNNNNNQNNKDAADTDDSISRTGRARTPSVVNWPTKPSSVAGDFFVTSCGHSYEPREHRMHMTSRSVMHKTRLFGQSHWANSIVGFRDIFEMIDPLVTDSTSSKVFMDMQRLKHMGRIIKALRVGPSWPPPAMPTPLTQLHLSSPGRLHEAYGLPPRELADELVACYLWSTESLYRILHVPMFRREYEALWASLSGATTTSTAPQTTTAPLTKADMAFVVQLKLVLAIGAATHRDHIALRTRAVRWFYAAQAWFAEPEYKAHLTMQILQIQILLLFAREATNIGGALIWISVGDVVRTAVYMGLHRDPDRLPKRMSRLAAEMRRRLWNTILEVVVCTSLDAGGPAMLSITDFDTRPPSNIDDEALEESVLAETAAAKAAAASQTALWPTAGATGAASPPKVDDNAATNTKNNYTKEIYIDNGETRGVSQPASAAELLEQEKRYSYELTSGCTGINKTDQAGSDRSARPPSEFTSMSVAIALRKTLRLRLAICKFLNDMGPPGTYANTLRFDRQFRAAYRALSETLQMYAEAAAMDDVDHDSTRRVQAPHKIEPFTIASAHLIMRRYLLCLHIPFFGASLHEETAYAYSRRVVCDTAMRIWHTSCPGVVDTAVPTIAAADFAAKEALEGQKTQGPPPAGRVLVDPALVRQTQLGAGALRRLAMQASLLVAAEAKFQLIEDDDSGGSGRAPIRPDLLAIIQAATHWCLRSIEAGETNFKGYLLWRLIETQLDGMRRGMICAPTASAESRMDLARELVEAAEEAERLCMPILDAMVARGQQEAHEAAVAAITLSPSGGFAGYGGGTSGSASGNGNGGPGTEVHNVVRMCRVEDCPCQAVFRQQQQEQQDQALEAAQLAEQQQNLQTLSTQPPFMPGVGGIQPPVDSMAIDFAVDNWEFIMPDAQSLNIGSGEPLSWLFGGNASQGILW
ncbi:hypothetical protein SCUCBS95973_000761 [Sporothrix curviconia]|uniref:Zn(2)-C6 fungal-type domain-containing protein n=1 Tax=Sporothrix curviconia TaxID=1260050 RepID=A0ABP0ASY4_9PEZI